MRRALCPLAAIATLLLGGCGHKRVASVNAGTPPAAPPSEPVATSASDWRSIVTAPDRKRLRQWRDAWTAALARLPGDPRVAREGALLQPDEALDAATPPPGAYKCRVTKLGAQQKGLPDFTAYPAFDCRIAANGALLTLVKLGGSQRPTGTLYPDGGTRLIFLGTMVLGDETHAQAYGRDPERDMAGVFERVGPARWRLVLPYPRWESLIDVIEFVPA